MNITILTSTLSPAAGGLSSCVPSMSKGLNKLEGIEAHVVGTLDPACPEGVEAWGPHVHPCAVTGPMAFQYAPEMSGTLRRLAPDVVDVQGLWTYPSMAGLRFFRKTGKPYIVTPHGMLDPWARQRSVTKKQLVRWLFQDAHLENAFCLRATAEMEAEHFRSWGLKQPIAIVPNSVETPPLVPVSGPVSGPRRLLFLSRVHPKKGLPFLLRAWAALSPGFPEWELVIAGPDERGHTAEMQALAAELRLERLIWPGEVRGAEKVALYRSSGLFVLPTHAENFGLVVAEALAHGVPVITTHNAPWSGLTENECGWWIDLSDHKLQATLAEAMARSPKDLRNMGERGHAWMGCDFGADAVAREMREVYLWAAHGASPPKCVHF